MSFYPYLSEAWKPGSLFDPLHAEGNSLELDRGSGRRLHSRPVSDESSRDFFRRSDERRDYGLSDRMQAGNEDESLSFLTGKIPDSSTSSTSSSSSPTSSLQEQQSTFSGDTSDKLKVAFNYFIPPTVITASFMWGKTLTVFFFLVLMMISLMWLYVNINYQAYADRINVLSLHKWFQQDPQSYFQDYVQNTAQESIAAAMNDMQTARYNLETSVNRLEDQSQRQYEENKALDSKMDKIKSEIVNSVRKLASMPYLTKDGAVKTTQSR